MAATVCKASLISKASGRRHGFGWVKGTLSSISNRLGISKEMKRNTLSPSYSCPSRAVMKFCREFSAPHTERVAASISRIMAGGANRGSGFFEFVIPIEFQEQGCDDQYRCDCARPGPFPQDEIDGQGGQGKLPENAHCNIDRVLEKIRVGPETGIIR